MYTTPNNTINRTPDFLLGTDNGHPVVFPREMLDTQIIPASYFGFRKGTLASPLTDDQRAAQTPDSSAAARDLEDWFTNWRERAGRFHIVQFEAGMYKFDSLTLRGPGASNADFYPRSGLILRGATSQATTLQATASGAAQLFGLGGPNNWTGAPALQGLRLRGAGAANPYQVGVFLAPDFSHTYGFAGITNAHWHDVQVLNFAREQIWLRGGSSDFNVPVQYSTWDNVRCDALTNAYPAFKMTGQMGPPWLMRNLECYGVDGNNSRIAYIGIDNRTGIPIGSVNTAQNCLVFSEPHRLMTTDKFRFEGGTAWGGLAAGTTYFVVKLDDFRVRLSTTLANSQANPPVVATLTSATGTATGTSYQIAGVDVASVQTVLDTPTFQQGEVGLELVGGRVDIRSLHVEETGRAIVVGAFGGASITDGDMGNAAKTGAMFDASASTAGRITLGGRIVLNGTVNRIAANNVNNLENVVVKCDFSGPAYYPTVGSGVTGKLTGLKQLGTNGSGEIDLTQSLVSECILNPSTTTCTHIRATAFPGQQTTFRVWTPSGEWAQFASTGNLYLAGTDNNGGLLRIPSGAVAAFVCSAVNEGWTLTNLVMPTHSATWTRSGNVAANGSDSTTITCPGARVGDPAPRVGLSVALTAGLILVGEVTATDTVTVRLVNPTAAALSGPTNPTMRVVQTR